MNRNQCNLYISNISDITEEDRLISYFSQFGKIESYTFLQKTPQRHSAAAIITYGLSVDIDYIIQQNQRIDFDNRTLFLRRTLPSTRPSFECFMSSNELLISLTDLSHDEQFNEINIRKYFSKFGSIVSCRMVIPSTTFLIDYVNANSVDCAILAEPHFYNNDELVLRKYVSTNRMAILHTNKMLFNRDNKRTKFSFFEKVRRLKHMIEAIQFGQKIELRLIKCSSEEKKFKPTRKQTDVTMKLITQIKNKSKDLNIDMERLRDKNRSFKLFMEQNQRIRKYVSDFYEIKIQNEQNRMNDLKEALDLLKLY